MFNFTKNSSGNFKMLIEGIRFKNLAIGKKTHMVKFLLKKGSKLPEHMHIQEQTGYMVKGKMILTIEGRNYTVITGDSWSIGSNIPHSAEIIDNCEVIEVFSPIREDYLD